MNTKKIGNLVELQCITRLYELGCSVSIPFGNSDKYDLIIDVDGRLYKVQVKHSAEVLNEQNEVEYITFKCTWQSHNSKGYIRKQYKAEEIDFFATYYKGECYLVPQKECSNVKILRINAPKNNQKQKISYLNDYIAEGVILNL